MNPVEIQLSLQTAITLIRQGQKEQGRDLLLQIVESDEQNEIAWLWLSAVVDSLDDQITALENVIALNPNNSSAQRGLAQLHAQQAATAPPIEDVPLSEPEVTPVSPLPDTPREADTDQTPDSNWTDTPEPDSTWAPSDYGDSAPIDSVTALDDPYQCVYCSAQAAPDLKRCPECGRNLMVLEGNRKSTASVRSAAFMIMTCIALSAIEASVLILFNYQNPLLNYIFKTLSLDLLFGNFTQWQPAILQVITWIQIAMLATITLSMLGLLYQFTVAYYASIIFVAANILWVSYRWITGYLGTAMGVPDILFALLSLFFIFAAQPDFQVNAKRLRCAIDSHVKGGVSLNRLGHIAKSKGQWALAVAYWRAAVAAMPNQADFYQDLAIGYAQIGYYQKAMSALNEYGQQSREAPDFAALKKLINQKRAKDKYPRG